MLWRSLLGPSVFKELATNCVSEHIAGRSLFFQWSAAWLHDTSASCTSAVSKQRVETPRYRLECVQKEKRTSSSASEDRSPKYEYKIRVFTGSTRSAGTPNVASLQLFGSQFTSGVYRIGDDADNDGGPGFARSSVKEYIISEPNLGHLKRIKVRKDVHQASEQGAGWFLDQMVVTGPDGVDVSFPCQAWIGEPVDGSMTGVAIPHPEKVKDGKRGVNQRSNGFAGEDAYFYTPGSRDIFGLGVSDGVYIWRDFGIDAGVLSRAFMDSSRRLVEGGCSDVMRMVERCQDIVSAGGMLGSATLCLAVVERRAARMYTALIGDSGIMVISLGDDEPEPFIKFRTSPQEHEFGYPYQLGHHETSDKASEALLASVSITPGDIIIIASDGLWDNIFDREIMSTAVRHLKASRTPNPSALVRELASTAYNRSQDRNASTPYSYSASDWFNMVYNGGKKDDITVVAAFVES